MLSANAAVDTANNFGSTALMLAAENGHSQVTEVIKYFLDPSELQHSSYYDTIFCGIFSIRCVLYQAIVVLSVHRYCFLHVLKLVRLTNMVRQH